MSVTRSLLMIPLVLVDLAIRTMMEIRLLLFDYECSWNSCSKQATASWVVSEEWIPAYLCKRHGSAVEKMYRRPEKAPDAEYWKSVLSQKTKNNKPSNK